ncbi:hypothetical protein G7043_40010 [Lentzea sp. NEAU-D13]|uniref:Zinc finger DksA/TraR C4-type domain-containing protein n=1 Tax=Lentzea alba TaxID=2714351 RepID=A0A7C9VWU9_9PSEU|nr:hypothetical protein [Lentzea alba]
MAEQVAAAATVALNDIDIALLRIDIGSYGRCQTCHADIPIRLLEAIPQLRLCLACQHTDTRKGSRHGEPVSRQRQRAPAVRAQTPARQRVRRGTSTAGRRDRHSRSPT